MVSPSGVPKIALEPPTSPGRPALTPPPDAFQVIHRSQHSQLRAHRRMSRSRRRSISPKLAPMSAVMGPRGGNYARRSRPFANRHSLPRGSSSRGNTRQTQEMTQRRRSDPPVGGEESLRRGAKEDRRHRELMDSESAMAHSRSFNLNNHNGVGSTTSTLDTTPHLTSDGYSEKAFPTAMSNVPSSESLNDRNSSPMNIRARLQDPTTAQSHSQASISDRQGEPHDVETSSVADTPQVRNTGKLDPAVQGFYHFPSTSPLLASNQMARTCNADYDGHRPDGFGCCVKQNSDIQSRQSMDALRQMSDHFGGENQLAALELSWLSDFHIIHLGQVRADEDSHPFGMAQTLRERRHWRRSRLIHVLRIHEAKYVHSQMQAIWVHERTRLELEEETEKDFFAPCQCPHHHPRRVDEWLSHGQPNEMGDWEDLLRGRE